MLTHDRIYKYAEELVKQAKMILEASAPELEAPPQGELLSGTDTKYTTKVRELSKSLYQVAKDAKQYRSASRLDDLGREIEKLRQLLGTLHVEITHPRALGETFCHCGKPPSFFRRPDGVSDRDDWEVTFAFEPSDRYPHYDQAQKCAEKNDKWLSEWPDTCQGETYVIRLLESDMRTEIQVFEDKIGSKKPT